MNFLPHHQVTKSLSDFKYVFPSAPQLLSFRSKSKKKNMLFVESKKQVLFFTHQSRVSLLFPLRNGIAILLMPEFVEEAHCCKQQYCAMRNRPHFSVWESCHKKLRRRKNKLRRNWQNQNKLLMSSFCFETWAALCGVGQWMGIWKSEKKKLKKNPQLYRKRKQFFLLPHLSFFSFSFSVFTSFGQRLRHGN